MRYLIALVFLPILLLGCAGATFTWNKLDNMRKIRGFKPGAVTTRHVVSDKWQQSPNVHWISWADEDIRAAGRQQLNLPKEVWDRYEIGDQIEIVYLPGDDSPYHRDGIFADDGNFAFDYGLFAIEIGMMVFAVGGAMILVWFVYWHQLHSDRLRRGPIR